MFVVTPTPTFVRQAKDILSRFPSLKPELKAYLEGLESHAPRGDQIPGHRSLWKDRLGMKAYRIGKSGGLRIIMYFDGSGEVFPAMIYFKRDIAQPTKKEIDAATAEILA